MKANMNLSYHENARMKHDDEAMDAWEKKTRREKLQMKLQCPNSNAQTPSPKLLSKPVA
jgi:hypothetical protein